MISAITAAALAEAVVLDEASAFGLSLGVAVPVGVGVAVGMGVGVYQLSYAGKNAAHINAHRRLEQVAKIRSVNAS